MDNKIRQIADERVAEWRNQAQTGDVTMKGEEFLFIDQLVQKHFHLVRSFPHEVGFSVKIDGVLRRISLKVPDLETLDLLFRKDEIDQVVDRIKDSPDGEYHDDLIDAVAALEA